MSEGSESEPLAYVDDKGFMAWADRNLTEIPVGLCALANAPVITLDLSYNSIVHVGNGLEGFSVLKNLVLDNNHLTSSQPGLAVCAGTLHSLSVNNNNIDDLETFLESLKPLTELRYLSMLKNPACPSPYFSSGDSEEYARYRLRVSYMLPKLEFLDDKQLSAWEKAEARKRGEFLRVVKAPDTSVSPPPQQQKQDTQSSKNGEETEDNSPSLGMDLDEVGVCGRTKYGVLPTSSYETGTKTGKKGVRMSEGNRFIRNDDL